MILSILGCLRFVGVGLAFFFGYKVGFAEGFNPQAQLHLMIPIVIVSIAGLSGIEGLFFGRQAAEAKGFESGSNYQRQSAIALLSYAVVSLVVYICSWGTVAELTIFFAFMFFFFFSAINHAVDAVVRKNYQWSNINRPFLTLLLIAGMLYPVIEALKRL
ncbi:MAG: hypothetical protein HY537_08520 [Deltaproteobacteria bacterium]|nr:hypothetical protein [Deltaproteobacteria bacterium]